MARPDDTWQLGGRVGRYRLDEELGRGGMGVVYAATDVESSRRVAIKTLLPHASATAAQRFAVEGEAQAKVDEHPNVLRVHAAGEAGGRRYLVMDLATGGDLSARLKQGALPPLEAAALARDLARGLAHVHARGVIHRDLKPGNVLFDEHGTARLVDFGLALLEGSDRLTKTGALTGTPAYMAPEQVDGKADARADVYSLGAVLFHMLTGQPPFATENRTALLAKLLMEPAPSPRTLNPVVPEALASVVLRCLAKRPIKRYATAAALADDLERVIAGEEIEAPAGSGALVGALAVAAFLLPVAGGLVWNLLWTASGSKVVDGTPIATTQTATVVEASGTSGLRDLPVPPTLGLPMKEKAYRCQWQTINGSPAVRSYRGTMTLGPATETGGVVTCPGRLSAITVWGGGFGEGAFSVDLEHVFPEEETVTFTISISRERELAVTGFERERRDALFALLPEGARASGLVDGAAWPGEVVKESLSNENVAHALRLSLPWTAKQDGLKLDGVGDHHELRVARDPTNGERVLTLPVNDEPGLPEAMPFAARWVLDSRGNLVECELSEVAPLANHPRRFAGTWWFIGPEPRFLEKKRSKQ